MSKVSRMMSKEGKVSSSSSSGIGTLGALFVAFVVLKLCGVIDWSWWWVTAPIWMPISALLLGAGLFFGGWFLVEALVEAIANAVKRRAKAEADRGSHGAP